MDIGMAGKVGLTCNGNSTTSKVALHKTPYTPNKPGSCSRLGVELEIEIAVAASYVCSCLLLGGNKDKKPRRCLFNIGGAEN
jgi:hypothetical protein